MDSADLGPAMAEAYARSTAEKAAEKAKDAIKEIEALKRRVAELEEFAERVRTFLVL